MPLKVWDGSSWTMAGQMKVWNGSSWSQLQAAKVWNGSSWVQFHPGVQLQDYEYVLVGPGIAISDSQEKPIPASASIDLDSSGSAIYSISTGPLFSYVWLLSGSASDYYAFMDTPSFGTFSFGTVNSAIQLSTGLASWGVLRTTVGVKDVISTLRIRTASGVDIVTIPVHLQAEVTL